MHATTEDDRLLSAWHSQRDPEAFRRLCERYVGVIEGVCRRHCSPDVPEAVQAVFLVLARRAGAVRGDSLGAWLVATAHRVVLNQHRSVARRIRHEHEAAVQHASHHADHEPVWVEAREHLDEALASLSAGRREAILRFYLAGRPQTEVATELGCSVAAVKMRVHEGLEGLRVFFARKGIACGAGALASGLASEATASDPTLVASCVQTVLTPVAAPGAAMLANGVFTAMYIKSATLVAAGLVLAGSCLTAALVVGAESASTSVAASAPQTSTATPPTKVVMVTPRNGDAYTLFWELERRGGPQVLGFGGINFWLVVPVELRFQAVEGRKLVEAVAATRALRTAWVRGGAAAVLYEGVPDGDVERARKELASADVVVRREAAWRAGWLGDVRVVPLLVKAAKDTDAEVARRALVGLRRVTWEVAVSLDGTAVALLTAELASWDATVRGEAAKALGRVGGEKVLALLEKALADQDASVRGAVAWALGLVGGDKALALLDQSLADQDADVRVAAASALGIVGGDKALAVLEKALAVLEKALTDQDANVRYSAINALIHVGGIKALGLLENVLTSQDVGSLDYTYNNMRYMAINALGHEGGVKALALLEKTLVDQDVNMRTNAAFALAYVSGDKAVALLEKTLADQDAGVRWAAMSTLARAGGDKALALLDMALAKALLEKALAAQDADVRCEAAYVLGYVGWDKALALLEKALADQDVKMRRGAMEALDYVVGDKALGFLGKAISDQDFNVRSQAAQALGRVGGDRALALLEKALADQDADVRGASAEALSRVGGDKVLPFLEKALADQDAKVRMQVAQALGRVEAEKAEKARDLLLGTLVGEKHRGVLKAVSDVLKSRWGNDPAVVKALKDFKLPEELELQPTPTPEPEPALSF